MTAGLAILLLVSGCSKPSGAVGEIELPKSFDRQVYLTKHFEHLETYCGILERLYAQPNSDDYVVSEIERLILSKILLVQAVSLDADDLDIDSVRSLIAVLRLAKYEEFGDALDKGAVLNPSIEYLRSIKASLRKRQEYLNSQIRY